MFVIVVRQADQACQGLRAIPQPVGDGVRLATLAGKLDERPFDLHQR